MILFILRGLGTLYASLPLSWSQAVGSFLGMILRSIGVRGDVIRSNLERAFPGESEKVRRAQLFREAYRHLGLLVLEILVLFGPWKKFVSKRAKVNGFEHIFEAGKGGRPVFMLSSHVGNWEIMAAAGSLGGVDLLIVTKLLKPTWIHEAIEKGRMKCGVQGAYEPKTLKSVLAHARKGGTIGFVLDQYMGAPIGIRVPFFETPVGTSSALALLAKKTGGLVLPVVDHRLKDGRHIVEIEPPLTWIQDPDPDREIALNTALYASTLEKHVRSHPEQWLWTHRRFKGNLEPLEANEWSKPRARQ